MAAHRLIHSLLGLLALCYIIPLGYGYRRLDYRDILKDFRQDGENRRQEQQKHRDSVKKGQARHSFGGGQLDATTIGDNDDHVQELYMTQRLDHFDSSNVATYSQRYFYSSRYAAGESDATSGPKGAISLLCVGGEGPSLDKSVLVDSVHCSGDMLQLAKTLSSDPYGWNVHVYALEHRYYGLSYPKFGTNDHDDNGSSNSPVSTHNLRYLSSRQALEDLAHFISAINSEQEERAGTSSGNGGITSSSSSPIWITFGGSYPGYLAAMARMFYPHLVYAAVSNSAPIKLEVDYPQYYDKVGWDLQYEKIGGSKLCFDIVKNGHEQAVRLLQQKEDDSTSRNFLRSTRQSQQEDVHHGYQNDRKSGRQLLAEMFNVCNATTALDDRMNQNLLVGDGLIGINAQENDPSCAQNDLCNIGKLCNAMVSMHDNTNATELEILAAIARLQRGGGDSEDDNGGDDDDDDTCIEINWNATLEEFSKPKVTTMGWRSWLWQTCTEVGYYQTCQENRNSASGYIDSTILTCPYATNYHLVDMDLEICRVAFNISATQVYENVQATIDHYGSIDNFGGKDHSDIRILSVNGDVDPWSTLGLTPDQSTCDMPIKMVKGASHHFWTHAIKDSDDPEIVEIREFISKVLLDWVHVEDEKANANGLEEEMSFKTDVI